MRARAFTEYREFSACRRNSLAVNSSISLPALSSRLRRLAAEHLHLVGTVWLVVDDARTQLDRLRRLGLGGPVVIGRDARPVFDEGA